MKDGYYKIKKLDVLNCKTNIEDKLNNIKLQTIPKNYNKIILIREDLSTEVLNV